MRERYTTLATISLSAIIIPLAFTGPAISTLAVGRELGGDHVSLGWIVNAYALAFGSCVMAAGAIGDQIGRKRCFTAGLWIFIITSLLIGLAPNVLLLTVLRAVEGVGGALMLTSSTSLLAQAFQGHERNRAFSVLGTAFGVGLAFGPLASGVLIEHLGWRSLYFCLATLAVLILILGSRRIQESRNPQARGIDWPGTLVFTAALLALTLGILRGPLEGWGSPLVLTLLGGAVLLLRIFIVVEPRHPYPMLELALFRYPRFLGVQLLPVATGFSFIALIVYLPLWFMAIQGRDTLVAGLAILPLTAPMLIVPLLAGRLASHINPGVLAGVGFCIAALGTALMMRIAPDSRIVSMAFPMLLIGIGNGLPWGLMDALSVSVVPKERAGMAAGIFTTMRVAGEAIAIAAISAGLLSLTAHYLDRHAETRSLSLPTSATAIARQIGAGATPDSSWSTDGVILELAQHAHTWAFQTIFGALTGLSLIAAGICLATLRTPGTRIKTPPLKS